MYAEAIALSEKRSSKPEQKANCFFVLLDTPTPNPDAGGNRRRHYEFREIAETQYVMSYWVATIYTALGDNDKAFAELEKAFAEHDWELHRLKVDPFMNSLRDDPPFDEMVKRIGLLQ